VYQVQSAGALAAAGRSALVGRRWVNRTVLGLGVTSLFTDLSAEMIATVLPLYLVFGLHLSPLAFGVVDGLYTGATAPVRLVAGVWADRSRRHKEVASAGYGLSTACRLGLLVVGDMWTALVGLVLADRVGKGIRTAPRDVLISLSTPSSQWGAAFGVHRSLDTVGAMLGPVLAFGVLALAPGRYDAVFVVSLCAGVIGLAVLVLFVHNPSSAGVRRRTEPPPSLRAALRLVRVPGFATLLLLGALLGLATLSDGFLYLALQDRLGFHLGLFPLLYVATAVVFMVLAVPVGRLADSVGRARVFVVGHAALLLVYALLLLPGNGVGWAVGCVLLLGGYYAATDGVLMALTSAVLPERLRTTGLGLLTTGISLARLLSSILFGLLWTALDVRAAVATFAVTLLLATLVTAVMLHRGLPEVTDADPLAAG